MDRRSFLKLTGLASATVAGVGCADDQDSLKILYAQAVPEETVPLGEDTWFATLCQECRAGCSILVRIVEGRAKKIEGNPFFPVNRGKTCARGQAALQSLYNPDRLRTPLRRAADGGLEPVDWDTALSEVAETLSKLRRRSQQLLIVTPPLTGHLHLLFHLFSEAFEGGQWVRWAPFEDTVLRRAVRDHFGLLRLPAYRLEDADLVVSFGADFLGTELSPVHLANQYGRFRQGDPRANGRRRRRGRWVHFEPRLSLTASNADRWIPIEPGTEGIIALALVRLLVERELVRLPGPEHRRWVEATASVSVEQAERHLDAPPGILERLAEELSEAGSAVIIAGGSTAATTNASANLWAIHALQAVLSAAGSDALPAANPPSPLQALQTFRQAGDGTEITEAESGFRRLEEIGNRILNGEAGYGAALVWGVDLLHALPSSSAFRQAFEKIPERIVAASFPDDTAERATLVLPASTALESWGDGVPDPGPGVPAWALAQPAVSPIYDTRSPGDLLLDLAKRLGGALQDALPWKDTAQAIDDSLFRLYERYSSQIGIGRYDGFFNRIVALGGWYRRPGSQDFVPGTDQQERISKSFPVSAPQALAANFEGDPQSYPFYLLPYPSLALLAGEGANRPWLQELGDPLTTVVWGTWAEVNPGTAADLGLVEGDEVVLESPFGSIAAPVYIYPGIRPDTVAVPAGGGHQAFGRYARKRGANVMDLLPASQEQETGALAWVSTRVKLTPTGRKTTLVKLEGSGRWLQGSEFPV